MNEFWGVAGALAGAAALLSSGLFASRATRAAARTTAEAQRAAALAAAEPSQRAADLASFREMRDSLERRVERAEARVGSLTSLVRAFSWYVSELTGCMRENGLEPPDPPERVVEYDRSGG